MHSFIAGCWQASSWRATNLAARQAGLAFASPSAKPTQQDGVKTNQHLHDVAHPLLQALVLEAEEKLEAQSGGDRASLAAAATTFYEVTIASIDQPKLLSRLSESLVGIAAGG